jgi:PhzF family phenazine biosynthesis protein
MNTDTLRIESYRPELAPAFATLNFSWIEKYFVVEAPDRKVLLDPEHSIIEPGGNILFALDGDEPIGCVALKPVREGVLELTKMAVREDLRGAGIGKQLMQAAIEDARRLGARELVLDTHSSLKNAIGLYAQFGFEHVAVVDSAYQRADVSMRHVVQYPATPVLRIAAFSDGETGGNPAGVLIADALPSAMDMQRIAAEVGFSETAFAAPSGNAWRVRYFSPETEVPFCGHATIALGAALALKHGDGVFTLMLNQAQISVEGQRNGGLIAAALQSPPTSSAPASAELVKDALSLFGYTQDDLDPRIPPALAHGGADHLVLCLKTRALLSAMKYDLKAGRVLMTRAGLVTILLACAETPQFFHTRNPFASGGIYEDPATGAATAALGGYLRDIGWPHAGAIDIVQGEDMGMRSLLRAEISAVPGSSIRVLGSARIM